MLPVVQIGRVALPTQPLMLLITFYAGLWLASREVTRRGFDGEILWSAGFLGLAAGLIGGRLAYVIQHWSAYREDLGAILSLTPGTISFYSALVVGLVAAFAYLARAQWIRVEALDGIAPGAALALVLLSLSNFLSGEAFGTPSDVPWAIPLWDARRHPVQLYEALALLGVLAILWRRRERARPGWMTWALVLGYGLTRLAFEPFRAEPWIWEGGYRGFQVLGLIAALVALWEITRPSPPGEEPEVTHSDESR